MEINRPLLSICIPTYNRADSLSDNLECLTHLNGFDDEIEVIISDNCSPDNTQEVGLDFASRYTNIKYYRNVTNIHDENFPSCLDKASGYYIKLLNDNVTINNDGLDYLKSKVKENLNDRVPIFFTNNFISTKYKGYDKIICSSFDDYLGAISIYVTAISCFGAWREQWDEIINRTRYSKLLLNQVDWSFQLMDKHKKCVIYNKHYYSGHSKGKRSGYNWFQVHLDNYYTIMKPYIDRGSISAKAFNIDKHNFLRKYKKELCFIYGYKWDKNWQYDTKDTFSIFWKYYKHDLIFYIYILSFPIWSILLTMKYLLYDIYVSIKSHLF